MAGVKALRTVQIGQETTPGTGVAASTVWRGMGVLKDELVVTRVPEDIGILGNANRTYIGKTGGTIDLTGSATFQQLGYVFQNGIKTVVPTTDTSSAYIWTWNVQSLASDPIASTDLTTFTIEGGDNQQAEEMSYVFTKEFKLSGAAGDNIEVTASMEGRTVSTATFTSSLAIPTVQDILFSKGLLYIDPSTDAPGTTLKSNTLLKMELDVKTGWMPVFAADGQTYFSFVKRASDEITLNITFEHDGTSVAEKANWRNQSERVIRLKFLGNALTTTDAGAAYDTFVFIIDVYGKWESFDALTDMNGNDTVVGKFRAGYSTGAAKKTTFILANESATLT